MLSSLWIILVVKKLLVHNYDKAPTLIPNEDVESYVALSLDVETQGSQGDSHITTKRTIEGVYVSQNMKIFFLRAALGSTNDQSPKDTITP
jgi:hypothetical protein